MKPYKIFRRLWFLSFIVIPFSLAAQDLNIQPEDEVGKESIYRENPEARYRFRYMQRADSNGNIPMDALLKAKKHVEKMPEPKDAGLWNWEWLGPGNIGGRIRAIAIHPVNHNIIFIGGVSGGIWKSTNSGSSWTVMDDFLPSLAITSIIYDPVNPNIMYASTGEGFYNGDALPGAGIFKSTDGGTTWSQLSSTNNNNYRYVNSILHHPDSTGVLYAALDCKAVVKTSDGGLTWHLILETEWPVSDIQISHAHPHNYLIVGTIGKEWDGWENSGEVYLSDDYGNTWTEQTTGAVNKLPAYPLRCEVSFCKSNPSRIYVSMGRNLGELWRSDNHGVTWQLINTGTEYHPWQQDYNNCIWVDPTNSNEIVLGSIDNWRSTDGGSTLVKISNWTLYNPENSVTAHADNHIIISHPDYDGVTNKMVFFGNDGGIQKTDDIFTVGESTGWINLANTTLGITQFYTGAASPDGSYITGGTQDNGHLRYTPSGGTGNWSRVFGGDAGCAAIDFDNYLIQYEEYTTLSIHKTVDGGENWFSAVIGLTDALYDSCSLFISPYVMDPNSSTTLIAGGIHIWRTINSAFQWFCIKELTPDTALCSAIDIADGNSDIIWVGYIDGNVSKTSNGTATSPTWYRKDNVSTPLPDRWVTDIAINPSNHNEVYITFGGYHTNNVWFTPDGGSTWENRSGTAPNDLPDIQVNTVRVNPHDGDWVYIGTDMGVFASEDKGLTWCKDPRYPSTGHEFPGNIEVDELFWQGDEYLIAATHGRGMFRAHPRAIIYVDLSAPAGGNGSPTHPYNNVTDAENAAGSGATISIKSNTYNEPNPLIFFKRGEIKTTDGPTIIK